MDVTSSSSSTEEPMDKAPSLGQADLYTHLSNNNSIIDSSEEAESNISLKLIPCTTCSRTFNPTTLQKHVRICEKMSTKKRNVFDSSRQRREGTELASYPSPTNYNLQPVSHAQSPKLMQTLSPVLTRKKPIDDFSKKSNRASVRKTPGSTSNASPTTGTFNTATTETSNAAITTNFRRDRMRSSERSLSKRSQLPISEQCPYCERCFGVKAFDRHVEWCKEKALQASIKLTSKNEQNVAKERLEARTKYRAPCLKTKRSINRDKYASLTGDENDSSDSPKSVNSAYKNNNTDSNNVMSLSLTSSIMSETTIQHHGNSNAVHNSRGGCSNDSNDNIKVSINAEKTLSLKPNITKREHQIRRSAEREIPDFRLNGEKCETSNNKTKKGAIADQLATDLSIIATNDSSVIRPRISTKVNMSTSKDHQDNRNEFQPRIGNEFLGISTPTSTSTAPHLLTKSLSSLSRRKLKTKEHSDTNFSTSKQFPTLDDINLAAISSHIVNTKEAKIKKLHPSMSLAHLKRHEEHQQESSILGLTQNTKLKSTVSTTAMNVHAKLETNPIRGPIICRPKRKKLQRQQNGTSAPLKAIPLLKESIETFGLSTKNKVLLEKRKEINIIKAPPLKTSLNTAPTLMRNKSFILRTKSNLESFESNHNEIFNNNNDPKLSLSKQDFDAVDKKKREIFISIETEQNDQGRSVISPDSLRSIVGDNQNPDVEEVPANDNKFSKIEDDDGIPISPPPKSFFGISQLPNIQLNNAKNLIQKMQDSFRQMGEDAGTTLRQAVLNSTPRSSTASNSFFDGSRSPLSTERSEVAENVASPVEGDSDEASSLESYPVSSQSSRRGVTSKLSADSAYGSLSRQRSSEFSNLNRYQIRSRPSTSSCGTNTALVTPMIDVATQHHPQIIQQKQQSYKTSTKRNLSRQLSAESSTSGSDVSMPPLMENTTAHLNKRYQDDQCVSSFEQTPQQHTYDNNSNENEYHHKTINLPTASLKNEATSSTAEDNLNAGRTSLRSTTPKSCSSNSINSSSMTSSMKMSRFCHECGSRFLIDEAKFCMDCGVKRLIL